MEGQILPLVNGFLALTSQLLLLPPPPLDQWLSSRKLKEWHKGETSSNFILFWKQGKKVRKRGQQSNRRSLDGSVGIETRAQACQQLIRGSILGRTNRYLSSLDHAKRIWCCINRMKRSTYEDDSSTQSSAEVKNAWSCIFITPPHISSHRGT